MVRRGIKVMGRVIFLLEEQSIKELLDRMLPRIFPSLRFLCIPHEGKVDLDSHIRSKLSSWRVPGDSFIIVRDNDGEDCIALKQRLRDQCQQTGHDNAIIRIVCQELEAWYLGQPDAMAKAFGDEKLRDIGKMRRFRNPDTRNKPSQDVVKLYKGFQKINGARRIADYLTREDNQSPSFKVFLDGVERLYRTPTMFQK